MKRMPFERPTDHYDERVRALDARLVGLLKERKEVSEDNPGYPPFPDIERWAASSGLYADFLKAVFGLLRQEARFKPVVEPRSFAGYVPIMRTAESGGCLLMLAAARQYENASVVTLHIDCHEAGVGAADMPVQQWANFELELGEPYECRKDSGGASGRHAFYDYVVCPALPADLSGLTFVFSRYAAGASGREPTGEPIVFSL